MSKLSKDELIEAITSIETPKQLIELHERAFSIEPVLFGETWATGFPYQEILDSIIAGKPYKEQEPSKSLIY